MFNTGNSFNNNVVTLKPARKVWREIRSQFPAGGKVSNVEDWVGNGKIPAGTPASWSYDDTGAKSVKCYTDAQITSAGADGLAALAINGHTQEDVPIQDANTVGTATVINDGELYAYMLNSEVATLLKENNVHGYKVVLVQ